MTQSNYTDIPESHGDHAVVAKTATEIEDHFQMLAPKVEELASNQLSQVDGLAGDWSADFMYDGKDFWLIDMGRAEDSYYFDKLCSLPGYQRKGA